MNNKPKRTRKQTKQTKKQLQGGGPLLDLFVKYGLPVLGNAALNLVEQPAKALGAKIGKLIHSGNGVVRVPIYKEGSGVCQRAGALVYAGQPYSAPRPIHNIRKKKN